MAETSKREGKMDLISELLVGIFLAVVLFALGLIVLAWVRRLRRLVATFTIDTTNASMPEAWKKDEWEVDEHRGLGVIEVWFTGGEMYINSRKVGEYIARKQKQGLIGGHDLRKELVDKLTIPDAILDLLIREQYNPAVGLYLKKYKGRYPFFWGTIYRQSVAFLGGFLYVRYLYEDGVEFVSRKGWLGNNWDADLPTLVLEPEAESSK